MKGSFYSYFDMSARQPNPNNHKFVYLAFSGKDEALRKNCLVQLTTEDSHTSFFPFYLPSLRQFIWTASSFCTPPIWSQDYYKDEYPRVEITNQITNY